MPTELNKGFAVIIDEQINQPTSADRIIQIATKIKEKGIPCCKFESIAEAKTCLPNFLNLNFLILDWQITVTDASSDLLKDENAKEIIAFIEEFRKVCFSPIFIMSSLSKEDIEDYFERFGSHLINQTDASRNFIFIKQKDNNITEGDNLFTEINNWINSNPAIHTLKVWDNAFLSAKNSTFWHLFNRSPIWPKILWDAFTKDSVDESYNLNETIYKLIKSRTSLSSIDPEILKTANPDDFNQDEIKHVLIGSMYLHNDNIPQTSVEPGDIYLIEGKYYLNLRPICDTIPGRLDGAGCPTWDNELYLLEGASIEQKAIKDRFSKTTGLIERITDVMLFGLDGQNFVQFSFNKIAVKKFEEIAKYRKERLLPPYINNVQQKYSAYVGRFGLPRIPDVLINSIITPIATKAEEIVATKVSKDTGKAKKK